MFKYLRDLWNDSDAASLKGGQLELLRYRSNLLGADLRITNFGGGNTSSKYEVMDPLTGKPTRVMAVKGSGGDLGSITTGGFAVLYLDRLMALENVYRGEAFEDDMVGLYPSCSFAGNTVAASIDTPLHGYLPFDHESRGFGAHMIWRNPRVPQDEVSGQRRLVRKARSARVAV
ncbi:MAG: hypothetical protein JNL62_29025, partial [Bryobacterales bacterium]|nr:hypothetical protein [Bryobacterales bacterium]